MAANHQHLGWKYTRSILIIPKPARQVGLVEYTSGSTFICLLYGEQTHPPGPKIKTLIPLLSSFNFS
jgi:hypothetical protein